jgi:hypothetical protein
VQLDELPVARRAPVLKAYLRIAPGARPHIPVDKDASLEEFAAIAAQFPVFRVRTDERVRLGARTSAFCRRRSSASANAAIAP